MASRALAPLFRSPRTTALPSLLDPFRLMDSLLSDVAGTRGGDGGELLAQPRMNIEDKGNEVRVTAELPGISENDVEVTLDDDMLIIAGEKRQEQEVNEGDMRLVERAFGRFRRAIQLPFAPDPDRVEAEFKDGLLTITVPKSAEQQSRQRHIELKRGSANAQAGSGESTTTSSGSSTGGRGAAEGQGSTTGAGSSAREQGAEPQRETADATA
ncbi:MAG TPA: Hsp20/alpha crystallin family protein [Sphingomicrobium sp.]|jgi:HSP20 family protein|nr:Hsp20/alpha crystallin family protein [Sphingomicrobium sp.]